MPRRMPPSAEDLAVASQLTERNRLEGERYLGELRDRLSSRSSASDARSWCRRGERQPSGRWRTRPTSISSWSCAHGRTATRVSGTAASRHGCWSGKQPADHRAPGSRGRTRADARRRGGAEPSGALRPGVSPDDRRGADGDARERVRRLAASAVAASVSDAPRLADRLRGPQQTLDATYRRLAGRRPGRGSPGRGVAARQLLHRRAGLPAGSRGVPARVRAPAPSPRRR